MSRKCARRKAFSAPFIELSVAYTLGVGKCCEYFIILLYAAFNGCLADRQLACHSDRCGRLAGVPACQRSNFNRRKYAGA